MSLSTSRGIDWIGLSEASRILGVSGATVRRWSDAGRLRVFMTPGGHRRFSRSGLEQMLPSARTSRPSLNSAGLTPTRMTRTYRRASRLLAAELLWIPHLTDEQRQLFRAHGRVLAAWLLQYLEAPEGDAATDLLREASASAAEYGRIAASAGLSLSQTVEGFLRFRAPFHEELAAAAHRRGFDTHEATTLLATAERAMDRLLVATMTGHSVQTVTERRSTRRTAALGGSGSPL